MISAPDRRKACALIEEAMEAGARQEWACAELGLTARTYRRWTDEGEVTADGRPDAVRPTPRNKLSEAERAQVLAVCHQPEHASLPPSQIVPRLADAGEYIASESTFYRVLRAAGEQHHRGRSQAPRQSCPPTSHCATGPCETWTWDISYLPGPAKGLFFYLYLIVDLYSRKIVGWEVYEQELAEHASELVRRAVWGEGCIDRPLVLHSDNGSPMKASTFRVTLEKLGVTPSYSRPRVSNDNPFSEALFRTCKYRPAFPKAGFKDLVDARAFMQGFVTWYNTEHRHSGIQFVTPDERHSGRDKAILAQRETVYAAARAKHPERWSGPPRNWTPVGPVWLNPEDASAIPEEAAA